MICQIVFKVHFKYNFAENALLGCFSWYKLEIPEKMMFPSEKCEKHVMLSSAYGQKPSKLFLIFLQHFVLGTFFFFYNSA